VGLIDTHTHLETFARRGELGPVLQRARAAGLDHLITIGTDTDDWPLYRELAAAHSGFISYTVGLHPCSVGPDWRDRVAQIEGYWANKTPAQPGPLALGEIGLDRFHLPAASDEAEKIFSWQRAALAEQLQLAKRLGCPVVIHSRGAFPECVKLVDAAGIDWTKVVFHCFTEGPREIAELMQRGGYGSFTGIITYKNADNVRAAALAQGLDRFMIETDAPYLTPMPHRGKPNEPAYLRHTAEYAAGVFGVGYESLAATSTANARRFWGI